MARVPDYGADPFWCRSLCSVLENGNFVRYGNNDKQNDFDAVGQVLRECGSDKVEILVYQLFGRSNLRCTYHPLCDGFAYHLCELVHTDIIVQLPKSKILEVTFVLSLSFLETNTALFQGIKNVVVCKFNMKGKKATQIGFPCETSDVCPSRRSLGHKKIDDMARTRDVSSGILNRDADHGETVSAIKNPCCSDEFCSYLERAVLKNAKVHAYTKSSMGIRLTVDKKTAKFWVLSKNRLIQFEMVTQQCLLKRVFGSAFDVGVRKKKPKTGCKPETIGEADNLSSRRRIRRRCDAALRDEVYPYSRCQPWRH
jgi:hypothetical protein